jgi:hypothetical protein
MTPLVINPRAATGIAVFLLLIPTSRKYLSATGTSWLLLVLVKQIQTKHSNLHLIAPSITNKLSP